jgi:F-type H+-transporting ATPase subunit delta
MAESTLARRYARALVEIGREHGAVDAIAAQLGDFEASLTAGDGLLRTVLENPGIAPSERRGVLDAVLAKAGYHPMVERFLRLLLVKGRMAALPAIRAAYLTLSDDLAGRLRAQVTTARALPPAEAQQVVDSLSATLGKPVVVRWAVDASLIGGLRAQVGDTVYDATVRARLDTLLGTLLRAPAVAQA